MEAAKESVEEVPQGGGVAVSVGLAAAVVVRSGAAGGGGGGAIRRDAGLDMVG